MTTKAIETVGMTRPAGCHQLQRSWCFKGWVTCLTLGLSVALPGCGSAQNSASESAARNASARASALTDEFAVSDSLDSILSGESSLRIASAADGRFVVVWLGVGDALYARLFTPDGSPRGPAFEVAGSGQVGDARVAMNAAGKFVIVWRTITPLHSGDDVLFQRFDADGVALGQAQSALVSSGSLSLQTPASLALLQVQLLEGALHLALAMNPDGDFVIGWMRHAEAGFCCSGQLGALLTLYSSFVVRPYLADGTPVRSPVLVAPGQTARFPSLAMNGAGEFVAAWRQDPSPLSGGGIYRRHYNASGVALGAAQSVLDSALAVPDLAMDASGNYVLLWSRGVDSNREMWAQRFNPDGSEQDQPISLINGVEFDGQSFEAPALAMAADGEFAVTWAQRQFTDDDQLVYELKLACFDEGGSAQQPHLVINQQPLTDRLATNFPPPPTLPTLAYDGYGDLTLAWQRNLNQTSEIRGRRIAACH